MQERTTASEHGHWDLEFKRTSGVVDFVGKVPRCDLSGRGSYAWSTPGGVDSGQSGGPPHDYFALRYNGLGGFLGIPRKKSRWYLTGVRLKPYNLRPIVTG
jgi:hypothetical protein